VLFLLHKYIMFATVDEKTRQDRLTICNECSEYVSRLRSCKQCGCYMPAKATFLKSECPLDKWKDKSPQSTDLISFLESEITKHW
jgi:ribosomal protein L32